MTMHASAWFSRHKRILAIASLPILAALWWAFRPEKLWMNRRVNEPAPFDTNGASQPIFTGRFDGQTGGRVTVFQKPGGEKYLRLRDLTVPDGVDAHVELAKDGDQAGVDSIDLGPLKGDAGDRNYDLPAAADLTKYNAVVIQDKRNDSAFSFSLAKLEPF
jgi:hypothetical protein